MIRRRRLLQAASGLAGAPLLGCVAAPGPAAETSERQAARSISTTLDAGAASVPRAPATRAADRAPTTAAQARSEQALHALNRLGYGPRPGELDRLCAGFDWDAWVESQLAADRLALPPQLQSRLQALKSRDTPLGTRVAAYREAERQANAERNENPRREQVRQAMQEAAEARLARALLSPRQLEERLVEFWFNHFNVFFAKGICRVLTGPYEEQAIRPHVLGRFRDLLGATARHPAMLFYLDNWLSSREGFTPRAPGALPARGLNENYARELMELHTIGSDGNYSQADVTALARALTGWTFDLRRADGFVFDPRRHDDADKLWRGRAVPGRGLAQGEWVLDQLARDPATARRLARKLAQHFVADEPPPDLVQATARSFLATDGDLRATTRTLLLHSLARTPRALAPQFKTPYRLVVSMWRATGEPPPEDWQPLLAAMRGLGQPLFGCVTPDGYKVTREAWLDPEALARRVELVTRTADRLRLQPGPLLDTLGPAIAPATREALQREPERMRAALLLSSPDFQNA